MTLLPADDSALARMIAAGDEAAAAALDGKYRPRLVSITRKVGVPDADCQDLVQEVLAAAMAQIRDAVFRGESSVGTWLNAILKRKIADYWRRSQRNPTRQVEAGVGDGALSEVVARMADPNLRIDVRTALGRLPALHRLVFVLNQFGGLTTGEIAARLGRPPGTIGRILFEAKERFRQIFRREDSGANQRLLEG